MSPKFCWKSTYFGIRKARRKMHKLNYIFRIRASMRSFKPKEAKYESKTENIFKFATLKKNRARVEAALATFEREKTLKNIE